jgi:hypothetical protein
VRPRPHLVTGLILLAMGGCGNSPTPPLNPELCANATTYSVWEGSVAGNYIGTSPQGSIQIQNLGQQPLNVTGVSLGGAVTSCPTLETPADGFCVGFSVAGDAGVQPPFSIAGLQQAFMGMIFTPTKSQMYTGTVTLTSNSQPSSSVCQASPTTITLNGIGVFPPPELDSLNPTSGFATGGTVVTLNGNYFRSGLTVFFGDAGATDVVLDGGSQIFATTPPAPAGTTVLSDGGRLLFVDVTVSNPDNQSAVLSNSFGYVFLPDGVP